MTPCDSQAPAHLRTIFDVLTLILILGSYIPQLLKITTSGSSIGIAAWYIILSTLSSSTQLAARIENDFSQLAFECVRRGDLQGWKAFSALLIFFQAIAQWICAVALAVVYAKSRHGSNAAILATVVSHAVLIIPVAFTILVVGRPDDDKEGYGSELEYAIAQRWFHIFLALSGLAFSLSGAVPQIRLIVSRFRGGEGLGSLSVLGLALQVVAFFTLGVSQALRLGWPHIGDSSQPPLSAWTWFIVVNGPAVGYIGLGICQLLVLAAALGLGVQEGSIHL